MKSGRSREAVTKIQHSTSKHILNRDFDLDLSAGDHWPPSNAAVGYKSKLRTLKLGYEMEDWLSTETEGKQ